ncbi:MAG: N-acetylmuramoyl-L-alanine amidase [Candidatus Zixiibacteriota bacterium]|nr:MAG: N-acetylmuramoyl-L-alanine amidase [candidate division Zixibacteria bacterium]
MNRKKFKIILGIFLLLTLCAATRINAKEEPLPRISVVYPREGAQIGASDSTFIFGSVTPQSNLTINGFKAKVHPNGAFLAFLPLAPGDFVFELLAEKDAGASVKKVSVKVPPGIFPVPADSFCIIKGSIRPRQNLTLTAGDVLETKFRGTPGCRASFSIDGLVEDVPMTESSQSVSTFSLEQAWGEREGSAASPVAGTYTGLYMVRSGDKVEGARVLFKLIKKLGQDSVYLTESSRGKIAIKGDRIPRVVEFVGSSVVARSGPKLGYTLLYQPPGIRAVASGRKGEWVRLRLAPGEDAWVHQDSITFLPSGTPIPKSTLTAIQTKSLGRKTQVLISLQEKLPFKVEQQTGPSALFLTVYSVTSNTDWIRYDSRDRLIKELNWDQPKKDVYQLKVFLNQKQQWGYDVFYEGNKLILEVKHQPSIRSGLTGVRICLDPGHSPDPGAVGPTGLVEKVVNLGIAEKLRKILVRNGAEVVMTRRGSGGVTLYDRPKIAVEKDCDILISIHNNALPDGVNPFYNNGTSTYYYHPQSLALAREIQAELLKRLKLPDFGTYYGNLVLTRPSQLPAVLVEPAFMMIPEQEALLKTDKFQKRCAQAIARGVLNFVKSVKE